MNMNLQTSAIAIAAIIAFTAMPASAQRAEGPTSEDSGGLEEILVTAERREASIQDVPLAVSAYGREMIENLQIEDTLDLINVVPNLFGGNNTGLGTANMYYLRAQGNDESISTFDPPVGTYVDDVYITRQNANNFSLFDVERIEVLRGPQGTLYGRNTTGGAISVVLRKPAKEFGGYIELGAGSYGRILTRGSIDIPASDKLLFKISAFRVDDEGYLQNTVDGGKYNDTNSVGFRTAARILASDRLTWDISVDYADIKSSNIRGSLDGSRRLSTSTLTGGLPSVLTDSNPQKSPLYGNQVRTLNFISNTAIDDVGNGNLNIIFGYRDLDQEFLLNFPHPLFGDDFFAIDNNSKHKMFSAEVKWSGATFNDKIYLTTGVFYLNEDNSTDFADYLTLGAPLARIADRVLENSTESFAAYLQGDIRVGEKGTLTLGARLTQEDKDIGFSGTVTTQALIDAGISTKQSQFVVTPRFAYSHEISDTGMFYVSATNGFKSGGWNAREGMGANVEAFGPEKIWSYEAGLRKDWLESRLRTNLTLFFSDLNDLQITSATPSGNFLTTNGGGLEVFGFEAEITALITHNWEVYGVIGLQNAKYVSLPTGCVVPNTDLAAFDGNCRVADPKRSPDATFSLSTSLLIPLGELKLKPYGLMRYIGKNVTGTRNLGANDASTVFNFGLSLAGPRDIWSVNIECKNCTNETYVTSSLFLDYYNLPRTFMAKVNWNFGTR